MKVAVLSDIHDRLDHLEVVMKSVAESGAERLFFLGDFCSPFSLAALADRFEGAIDLVFGNNDGDQFLLSQIGAKRAQVTWHAPLAEIEIEGRKVALHHYPEIARRLAESGAYDAVFSGHDHQRYVHQIGDTLWANPGEIMGRFGVVSYGIWDSSDNAFEPVECRVDVGN